MWLENYYSIELDTCTDALFVSYRLLNNRLPMPSMVGDFDGNTEHESLLILLASVL